MFEQTEEWDNGLRNLVATDVASEFFLVFFLILLNCIFIFSCCLCLWKKQINWPAWIFWQCRKAN